MSLVPPARESVAVVVVTYQRADLLPRLLDGLAALHTQPDAVVVVDNATTDGTAALLAARGEPWLQVLRTEENIGGAGGFRLGTAHALAQGYDRVWLMDDDVVPAPDCLDVLLAVDEDCLMAVREDLSGALCEKAALRFDLRNPLALLPKTAMVETTFGRRDAMPARVALDNVAFEGFMVRTSVLAEVGLPDASFFVFYDDVDLALRIRATGRRIWAVRDAVLVRQLDFSQQHDLAGWKGFYMYRNLFAVHFRHGENRAVRLKPWLLAAGVVAASPLRGGLGEARNVIRAALSARAMRHPASRSVH